MYIHHPALTYRVISLSRCSINVGGQLSFLPHDSVGQGPWLSLLYMWGNWGSESLRDLPSLLEGSLRVTLVSVSPYPGLAAWSRAHPVHGCGSQGWLRKVESMWEQRRNLTIQSAQNTLCHNRTEHTWTFWCSPGSIWLLSVRGVDCSEARSQGRLSSTKVMGSAYLFKLWEHSDSFYAGGYKNKKAEE